MIPTPPKPLCLLVGGNARKREFLEQRLANSVHLSQETASTCFESARFRGAQFAVVFWSHQTHDLAHRLSAAVPGLRVLVESNPLAMHGKVERNGFQSVFETGQELEVVAEEISALCQKQASSRESLHRKAPNIAAGFLSHLPELQASIEESHRLGEHLLQSLVQASQASKGIVFFSPEAGADFSALAKVRLRASAPIPSLAFDSALVHAISETGAIAHRDDYDLPLVLQQHLDLLGCNLLVPVISEEAVRAWILLKVKQPAIELDFSTLQVIAHFAGESFRIGADLRARQLREAHLQAGLEQLSEAVAIFNRKGSVEYVSDPHKLIGFKPHSKRNAADLSCGSLKTIIAKCLRGETASHISEYRDGHSASVLSLDKSTVILAIRRLDNQTYAGGLDREVLKELCSGDKLKAWRETLRLEESAVSTQSWTISECFAPIEQFKHVSVLVPETLGRRCLALEQHAALRHFATGLVNQAFKEIRIIVNAADSSGVIIECLCEFAGTSSAKRTTALGNLELGILSLMACGARIRKKTGSVGCHWIIELPSISAAALSAEKIEIAFLGDGFPKPHEQFLNSIQTMEAVG